MVFLRPLLVVPGIIGPIIEEVYFIISVSGGSLTRNKLSLEFFKPSLTLTKHFFVSRNEKLFPSAKFKKNIPLCVKVIVVTDGFFQFF
jgi:hypothetical protein